MRYITAQSSGTVHPRVDITIYHSERHSFLSKKERLSFYRKDEGQHFVELIEFNRKRISAGKPAYFFVTDGTSFYHLDRETGKINKVSIGFRPKDFQTCDLDDVLRNIGATYSFGMSPGQESKQRAGYEVSGPEIHFFHGLPLEAALELQGFVIDWTAANTAYGGWIGSVPDAVTYEKADFG